MRYEVTVTLKPTCYRLSASEQFRITSDQILQAFRGYKVSIVAELTAANNVHYHGMVEITNFIHRDALFNRLRQFHKTLGKSTCTQLVNEPVWIEYLRKSVSVTDKIINRWPWVKDDFQISGDIKFRCTDSGNIYIEGYDDDIGRKSSPT